MTYSEAAYFDGAPVQHIADWQEHLRLKAIERKRLRARANREWLALPDYKPMRLDDHIRSLSPARRAELNAEWGQ